MIVYIDGLKVYYEAVGKGEPIVLLHGWGADANFMRPIVHMLQDCGKFRVYALDFPGFGLSECPQEAWDVSRYASFVINFFDNLDLQCVNVLGHSFGGRIAIKLASNYPSRIKRLILVDSAGIKPKRNLKYTIKIGFVKVLRKITLVLPDGTLKEMINRIILSQGSRDYQKAGKLRKTFVKVVNEDLRNLLPLIHCPTLIIWGGKDVETPLEDGLLMSQLIPNSRLEVLNESGHFPFIDNPREFKDLLMGYLGENP
jgi:pimeloyl-ACP methyl ester carboxylesterase